MKKDAYYFPHFSNARTDRKIRRLRKELGIEGYGIYFMLLEVLRENEYIYPIDDIDLLADDFNTSIPKVKTVITNYKLFEIDKNNMFFSIKLTEYMEPYLKMKEQRRKAGIASARKRVEQKQLLENSTTVQRPFNDRSTTVQQSKVKKRKENEIKLNGGGNENLKIPTSTNNTIIFQFDKVKQEILKDQEYTNSFNLPSTELNNQIDLFLKQIKTQFEDDGTPCSHRPLGRHKNHFAKWLNKTNQLKKTNGYTRPDGKKVAPQ